MASASASEPPPQSPSPDTLDYHMQKVLDEWNNPSDPFSLFSLPCSPAPTPIPLSLTGSNNLLLYPGSFNPPHLGHLATILYFYEHRADFDITCLFIFADPETVVGGRDKKHNVFVMEQEFRYELFASHPLLAPLISSGFLKIISGSMTSHIAFLRLVTDLIKHSHSSSSPPSSPRCSSSSLSQTKPSNPIRATLTGFLGGDKLSLHSSPHEKPGELIEWGPVDEFLIMNARRPVDFYTPSPSPSSTNLDSDVPNSSQSQSQSHSSSHFRVEVREHANVSRPSDLPGCTEWKRGPLDSENLKREETIGRLWSCKALTVPGLPVIHFRASDRSASNGISSTKIRKIMCEVEDSRLLEELKDKVVCPETLVKWLVGERKAKRERLGEGEGEGEGEKAFL